MFAMVMHVSCSSCMMCCNGCYASNPLAADASSVYDDSPVLTWDNGDDLQSRSGVFNSATLCLHANMQGINCGKTRLRHSLL